MGAKKTYGYDLLIDILEKNRRSQLTNPTPRDSDKEIIVQLLQFSGADLSVEQMEIIRRFNFESITRARRKLQEQGKYPPDSPEVAKKRRLKAMEIEQVAPKESAAGLHRRIQDND